MLEEELKSDMSAGTPGASMEDARGLQLTTQLIGTIKGGKGEGQEDGYVGGLDEREKCDAGNDGDVAELLAGTPVAGVQWIVWTVEVDKVWVRLTLLLLVTSTFWRSAWGRSIDICLDVFHFPRRNFTMMLVYCVRRLALQGGCSVCGS